MRTVLILLILTGSCLFLLAPAACADEVPKQYWPMIDKGLKWLVKQQHKDGHWSADGHYPLAMTGLAGIALLNEGSTVAEGKYADNIRRAVKWLISRGNKNNRYDGLIGDPEHVSETGRYMFGHAYALLFLARTYGDVEDRDLRKELRDVLVRGVKFSAAAQATNGGWFYTARVDGHDQDEAAVTMPQIHALRAAKNAGIAVPKPMLKKALEYTQKATTKGGGIAYSLARREPPLPAGGERPPITAAALGAVFHAGQLHDPYCKAWFKYCSEAIPLDGGGRLGYDEYLHYYYAQAIFELGDDGWKKMFPDAKDELTWSKYRRVHFDRLQKTQDADGSWGAGGGWGLGPVYPTAVNLTILQLDNTRPLRIHHR